MENAVQIFDNPEFGEVRVVMIDGEPWLVGKDVATALGYSNPRKALKDHVPDKYKKDGVTIRYVSSNGVEQRRNVTLINEAGMYKLVMRSKLESAEKFSDWVCEEVLPSIRKTGSYSVAPVNPTSELAAAISKLADVEREKLAVEREKLAVANSEEAKNFAKAQLLRELASASGDDIFLRRKLVRTATKIIMGENFFNDEQNSSDID